MMKEDEKVLHCYVCGLVYVPQLDVFVAKKDYEDFLMVEYGLYSSGVCGNIQCGVGNAVLMSGGDSDLERGLIQDWVDCQDEED